MPPVSVWSEAIFDLNGRPLPGTAVTIYTDIAGTILAPVFTDATGATPQPGSTYTTVAVGDPTYEPGNLTVFAAPGSYIGRALGQNRIFPVVVPVSNASLSATFAPSLWWIVVTAPAYGAKCDAISVNDLVTTSGSPIVTSASAPFLAGRDEGKLFSTSAGTGLTTTIANVQSTTQVTLAASASASATGRAAVFATDDTAAIVAALAAAAPGQTVYVPGQSGINGVLNVPRSVTLLGGGASEVWGNVVGSGGTQVPSAPPWVTGSVLIQFAPATNGINVLTTGPTVNAQGIGIRFADGIAFNNTGHGIYAVPMAMSGAGHENGLTSPRWDNIVVFGHDGNHYAYYTVNMNYGTQLHPRSYGGGGWYQECDSIPSSYGNGLIASTYFAVITGGTAHGFYHKSRTTSFPGSCGLMTFVRPQANILSAPPGLAAAFTVPPPLTTQKLWLDVGDPPDFLVIAPDFEAPDALDRVTFGAGTVVIPGGGIIAHGAGGGPAPFRTRQPRPGVPALTFGNGAGVTTLGTGSVTGVNAPADDERGQVQFTTGTGLYGADGGPVCTVTLQAWPGSGIGAVLLQASYPPSSFGAQFYVKNVGVVGGKYNFDVWSHAGLAASTAYGFMYHVVE